MLMSSHPCARHVSLVDPPHRFLSPLSPSPETSQPLASLPDLFSRLSLFHPSPTSRPWASSRSKRTWYAQAPLPNWWSPCTTSSGRDEEEKHCLWLHEGQPFCKPHPPSPHPLQQAVHRCCKPGTGGAARRDGGAASVDARCYERCCARRGGVGGWGSDGSLGGRSSDSIARPMPSITIQVTYIF